jgi:hypothetical protein
MIQTGPAEVPAVFEGVAKNVLNWGAAEACGSYPNERLTSRRRGRRRDA